MTARLHAAADLTSGGKNAWYSLDMQGEFRAGFDKMAERNISEEYCFLRWDAVCSGYS